MIEVSKYILFRTVLIIIALHAIIPHPHSDELTNKKHAELHKDSYSFVGIIKLVFHESDDESLDNLIFIQYEPVKEINSKHKYPKASLFNSPLSVIDKRETRKIVKSNTSNFNKLFYVKLNGLRGPPA